MRSRNVIRIQFANQKRGLSAKVCRNSFDQFIVVWISLFENVEGSVTGNIDSFHPLIVGQIVRVVNGWKTKNNFPRVCVQRQEFARLASYGEQAVIGLIERQRCIL